MARKHIYFSGVVQGVGFRFRCQNLAKEFYLTGWCRNLSDGRVEAEVQGLNSNIERFITRLGKEPFVEIDHVEIIDIPEIKGEKKFRTSYYY